MRSKRATLQQHSKPASNPHTLKHILALQALLSDLRKIAYQLLTSLSFLRVAGLTHADLKLENILMCRPCTAVPDPMGLGAGIGGTGGIGGIGGIGGLGGMGGPRGWGSVGIKLADFGNAFGELSHEEEVRKVCFFWCCFSPHLDLLTSSTGGRYM